jgi:hypothetical protein
MFTRNVCKYLTLFYAKKIEVVHFSVALINTYTLLYPRDGGHKFLRNVTSQKTVTAVRTPKPQWTRVLKKDH